MPCSGPGHEPKRAAWALWLGTNVALKGSGAEHRRHHRAPVRNSYPMQAAAAAPGSLAHPKPVRATGAPCLNAHANHSGQVAIRASQRTGPGPPRCHAARGPANPAWGIHAQPAFSHAR